jgi:hypothetical protein
MTTPTRPLALLAAVLVLAGAAGAAGAVPAPRDAPAETTPPVRVFVDETLDVSGVELTGGGTVGTDAVTLVGVAGDADGTTETLDDPTDADFGGFATGSYDVAADGDDRPEFSVADPRVTSVVVRNRNGANVTNGWEPSGRSLTVTAEYNFDAADRLDLTVEDPDGLDVTASVAAEDRITTSGGGLELDLSDQDDGTFRITLEGSDLDRASRTVTVRTGPRETATPLPTGTASPSPTPTATATPTPSPTPTATPTETPTATGTAPATATRTPTPTSTTAETTGSATPRTTATTTPGLGPAVAVSAVLVAAVALGRR